MRIICDTAAMIKPDQAEKLNITVLPLNVTISGNTYREYYEIDTPEFVELIRKGGVPTSSQPSVGEVMDAFEASDEETIAIAMADGLSGTYQTFEGVKQSMGEKADHITVVNSRALAGPETLLVEKAIRMRDEGCSKQEILDALQACIDTHMSFLIPQDFGFLERGGRLSPLAAKIGGLIKIVPVLIAAKQCTILEKYAIKRNVKGAVASVCKYFKEEVHADENYTVFISHSVADELAEQMKVWIHEALPEVNIRIMELTPAFTTQGGPGCVALQIIHN